MVVIVVAVQVGVHHYKRMLSSTRMGIWQRKRLPANSLPLHKMSLQSWRIVCRCTKKSLQSWRIVCRCTKKVYSCGEQFAAALKRVYSRGEQFAAAQNEFIVAANSLPLHKKSLQSRRIVCRCTKKSLQSWRIVCRSTKMRLQSWRIARRQTKTRKGCR